MTEDRKARGGINPMPKDKAGRERWRLRGRVDGITFSETFTGTKRAAGKRLTELRRDAAAGKLAGAGAGTVEGLFADYIERRVKDGELRTGKPAATHRGVVANWIVPNLPTRLADVRRVHVQKIADAMIDAGRVRSTPQVRAVVVGGFRWAQRTDRISINPAEGVSWPKVEPVERPALADEVIGKVLDQVGEDYRAPLSLDAATGLRASEVAGLRWADVMLDVPPEGCPRRGTETDHPTYPHVDVTGSLQRVGGQLVHHPPKSARGRRWVPLPEVTVTMLRAHRKEQTERRMRLGPAWHDADAVFDTGDGHPMDPDSLGVAFRRAAKAAKVTGYHLHDLRHAYVTRLVANRIDPATVSRIAGHATVAFTLDRYYHPGAAEAAGVAGIVDAALGGVLGGS